MPDETIPHATLAVLAGGAGSRMGRPKAELVVAGLPILQFLLDRLTWPGPTLLVTAPQRQRPPGSERFDREVSDAIADEGPLRGVVTALDHAETDASIIATLDMPNIQREQLHWLQEQLNRDLLGVMLQRQSGQRELIEPFPLVVRKTAAPLIRARLARDERSVHGLSEVEGFAVVPVPASWPVSTWDNLNDPVDYKAFIAGITR
jgi:molybdopterin-guanine dinucleotide biosynthesis protein A